MENVVVLTGARTLVYSCGKTMADLETAFFDNIEASADLFAPIKPIIKARRDTDSAANPLNKRSLGFES